MSNVYKALERAERERRVVKPDEVTITDRLAEAKVPVFHRPSDPYYLREYERLATEISHAHADAALRTMMVTSPQHGEGTSTVSVNLALTLAERGRLNVLLVDANFRRPALRQIFHADGTGGLAELVSKEAAWAAAVKETANANLHLVTVGRPAANPSQFFELERFGELLDEFRTRFDITIFDAPPVLPYADALTLASKVDRVIMVVQAGRTRRDRVERGKEELEKIGASIFGVVLNREKSYVPLWLQRYFNL